MKITWLIYASMTAVGFSSCKTLDSRSDSRAGAGNPVVGGEEDVRESAKEQGQDEKVVAESESQPAVEEVSENAATAADPILLDKVSSRDGRRYIMHKSGKFFRFVVNGVTTTKCQITTDVAHFKISQHQKDVAILYFLKKRFVPKVGTSAARTAQDLWILRADTSTSQPCPAVNSGVIMSDLFLEQNSDVNAKVGRYTVTPNAAENLNTKVVNMALGFPIQGTSELRGWDDRFLTVSEQGIKEYVMNTCYGVSAKAFRRYVAFALKKSNACAVNKFRVLKIDGDEPALQSSVTTECYKTLADFKKDNKVCAAQSVKK
jgi:hypothetical protein